MVAGPLLAPVAVPTGALAVVILGPLLAPLDIVIILYITNVCLGPLLAPLNIVLILNIIAPETVRTGVLTVVSLDTGSVLNIVMVTGPLLAPLTNMNVVMVTGPLLAPLTNTDVFVLLLIVLLPLKLQLQSLAVTVFVHSQWLHLVTPASCQP